MMKMIKSILTLFLLLSMLTACGKEDPIQTTEKTAFFTSVYPYLDELQAREFSPDDQDLWQDPDYPYNDCRCVVSEFYGKLLITDGKHYENDILGITHTMHFGDYWGNETGVFHQDENGDNEVATTEALICLIPTPARTEVIALTGGINEGSLRFLKAEFEKQHTSIRFDGMPMAASYSYTNENEMPPSEFYIATDRSVIRVLLGDYLFSATPNLFMIRMETLDVPDYWEHLEVNSMCQIGGTLYMGTQMGILAYDIAADTYTYYPVDYKKAIEG